MRLKSTGQNLVRVLLLIPTRVSLMCARELRVLSEKVGMQNLFFAFYRITTT